MKTFIEQFGRLRPGNAAWFTQTGDLKCKAIIHAVCSSNDETVEHKTRAHKNLRQAIRKILNLAKTNDLRKYYLLYYKLLVSLVKITI